MGRREAEGFETALQRAAQGHAVDQRWLPLIQTAQQAAVLAEPPLPPPQRLAPGRQLFLAEAARLRAGATQRPAMPLWLRGAMRPAAAFIAVLLIVALALSTGQAVSASLPGEGLYSLKLAAEDARLAITRDPQVRATLSLAQIKDRLDEIVAVLAQGRPLDEVAAERVRRQLAATLMAAVQVEDAAAAQALQRLETALRERQQTMTVAMDDLPEPERTALGRLVRLMERVREEAQAGQVDPAGLRQRLRQGVPLDPAESLPWRATPRPSSSPGPEGPQPTDQSGAGPGLQPSPIRPGDDPGSSTQPTPTSQPPRPIATEQPSRDPSPSPRPTDGSGALRPTGLPSRGPGPSPGPTEPPGRGQPTEPPGPTLGPPPTDGPSRPGPTEPPGGGPGRQPTAEPGGAGATDEPGSDPGSGVQPTNEPQGPGPTGEPGGGPGPDPDPGDEPGDPDPVDPPGAGPGPEPGNGGGSGGGGKP